MNPVAATSNFPILALRVRGVQKARIPNERHTDNAPVAQGYAQRVVAECNVEHALICRDCRRTHPTPPGTAPCSRSPWIVPCGVRARENRSWRPVVQGRAKTSPTDRPGPHEY